ncbi:MAG: cupin domain-containing protein [Nitriliruptorales bacterium]|nr:cupin domain-containing protein [Nitriliruptorales bacterium]
MTFYDEWLGLWGKAEEDRRQSRRSIQPEELEWVETVQDARTALVIAPETGFRTWGMETILAELPAGHKTGAHRHGEEAIYIVEGEGFSVVNGVRYDWKEGSSLAIPFGAAHQHFNTGGSKATYVSVMSVHLEAFCGLHFTEQLEEKGTFDRLPDAEASPDGLDVTGRRIRLHIEDAPDLGGGDKNASDLPELPEFSEDNPLVVGDLKGMEKLFGVHKSGLLEFMRVGKDRNDFQVHEQEISGILIDPPYEHGGKHAHMEAHLFILDGEGYSIVGDEKVPWKKGGGLFVPGPQTPHQHVNESGVPARMLRIASGIRYFFEKAAQDEWPYLYLAPRQGSIKPAS